MKMASGHRVIGCALLLLPPLLCAPRVWAHGGTQTPAPTPAPTQASSPQEQPQSNADQLELIRALNLTPEQRAQIAVIRRETEEQARQITVRLRRARRALEQAIYSEHTEDSLIEQRAAEVADAEAARVRMRAEAELKVRRVLTPEQFTTFRELRRQAQIVRRRQNALDAGVAPRTGARQGLRNPARNSGTQTNNSTQTNNGTQTSVPSLFPRQPRPPRSNRRQPARP